MERNGYPYVWGYNGDEPYWKVYRNTGSAFALESTNWPVPEGGYDEQGFCMTGSTTWATMDLEGDGLPDLVSTSMERNGYPYVWGYNGDEPYWKLYRNTGSAFETSSSNWPVPEGGYDEQGFCMTSSTYWATMDLNGDGRVDLVSTSMERNGYPYVWGYSGDTPYWKLYANMP
jgi:beta-mannanase